MLYDRHTDKHEMFLVYKILAYSLKLTISLLFNHHSNFFPTFLPCYLLNSFSVPGSLLDVGDGKANNQLSSYSWSFHYSENVFEDGGGEVERENYKLWSTI